MRFPSLSLLLGLLLAAPAGAMDHGAWDSLLKEHVSGGLVDYEALSAQRPRLDAYLEDLAEAEPDSWSRENQMAFWANAYNARMVALVLDHFPIRGGDPANPTNSVLQVPGIFKKLKGRVGGRELSLDQIEHEILRPRFKDARIHAAIVCASGSCPELRAEAFTAERLEEQLEDQFRRFLHDPRRNRFDLAKGSAQLSKIFDWFGEDFSAEAGPALRRSAGRHASLLAFLAPYLAEPEREALRAGRLRVEFLPYDWALNDAAAPPSFGR